jgi:hypothetical protein
LSRLVVQQQKSHLGAVVRIRGEGIIEQSVDVPADKCNKIAILRLNRAEIDSSMQQIVDGEGLCGRWGMGDPLKHE